MNLSRTKKTAHTGVMLCLLASAASASDISLAWNPPTVNTDGSPLTDLAGFCVHYGLTSGVYGQSVDVGSSSSATVVGLQEGRTYYFAVRAYNSAMVQSDYSGEFSCTAPDVTPPVITGRCSR